MARRSLPLHLILAFTLLLLLGGCGEDLLPGSRREAGGNIAVYQKKLEARLLQQYRNHPVFGARVDRVELEISRDIQVDTSGKQRKVEWSQLVYDKWNRRIPELEKEFFVVVFGPDAPIRYNAVPKLDVGMQARGGYSEHALAPAQAAAGLPAAHTGTEVWYCPVCGNRVAKPGICAGCLEAHQTDLAERNRKALPPSARPAAPASPTGLAPPPGPVAERNSLLRPSRMTSELPPLPEASAPAPEEDPLPSRTMAPAEPEPSAEPLAPSAFRPLPPARVYAPEPEQPEAVGNAARTSPAAEALREEIPSAYSLFIDGREVGPEVDASYRYPRRSGGPESTEYPALPQNQVDLTPAPEDTFRDRY